MPPIESVANNLSHKSYQIKKYLEIKGEQKKTKEIPRKLHCQPAPLRNIVRCQEAGNERKNNDN